MKTTLLHLFMCVYSVWEVIGFAIAWIIVLSVHSWWWVSIPFLLTWELAAFLISRKLGIEF